MGERFYWLGFSVFSGVGPLRFKKLIAELGSAENAWNAKQTDLKIHLGDALAEKFEDFRSKFSIEKYSKTLIQKEISFLILTDPNYPLLLKQIKNPPFVLYIKGSLNILLSYKSKPPPSSTIFDRTLAIVGTRKITQYGREATKILTKELVDAGFTIVSGLALGVDAVAHQTAIELNGKTIAVLGSGIDLCYPSANKQIYNSIIQKCGVVVSEFPLGQKPSKGSFPSRNRIIAGLSIGVLATEGAEDSGSLITADYAFKFNRKVFAVPGPIMSSLSKGPYKLIKKGAKLVTSAEDILKEFPISNFQFSMKFKSSKSKIETKEEQKILDLLRNETLHFDQIAKMTRLDSAKLGSILSIMEIKGLVKSLNGGVYSIEI